MSIASFDSFLIKDQIGVFVRTFQSTGIEER